MFTWRNFIDASGYTLSGAVFILIAFSVYAETHFYAYQDDVDALLTSLPAAEAKPPRVVRDVVPKVEGRGVAARVSSSLVARLLYGDGRPEIWREANLLWSALLPLRLEDRDMLVLYGHFLPFEGGQGLAYGARAYFAKAPGELTPDEVLGLVAIARAPKANSPTAAPESYQAAVAKLRETYRIASEDLQPAGHATAGMFGQ